MVRMRREKSMIWKCSGRLWRRKASGTVSFQRHGYREPRRGQDFEDLPITYTIFITENDIFGQDIPIYAIERMNMQTGQPFDDGEHILYVNGAFRDDSDIGRLMHDFGCSDPDDMYFQPLADRARYYKETPEGVSAMCKAMDDLRKETRIEAYTTAIKNIMEMFHVDADKAMDTMKIPMSERAVYTARL